MESNDTFAIVPVALLGELDFSRLKDTSIDTVRRSVDGTKAVIFWEGDPPAGIEWPTFTLDEIREVMAGPEWTSTEPLDE